MPRNRGERVADTAVSFHDARDVFWQMSDSVDASIRRGFPDDPLLYVELEMALLGEGYEMANARNEETRFVGSTVRVCNVCSS